MRRYGQDESLESENKHDKKPSKKGFSSETAKNGFLALFSKHRVSDKNISEKIYDIVSDEEENQSRKRARGSKKTSGRTGRSKNDSKSKQWLKKSLFVAGNIRFTRFAAAIVLFSIIALTSGTIVLAASTDIFGEDMPIENEDIIPAQKTVYINDNGSVTAFLTDDGNVRDILSMAEIEVNEDDKLFPPMYTALTNRMMIEISRAIHVEVMAPDETHELLLYKGTVGEALKEVGIEYDEDDIIDPLPEEQLSDGDIISFSEVTVETVTEEVKIEYETEYQDEPTILKGYWNVKQKGKDGLAEVTYEITYVNGEETNRKAIEENMIQPPINRIELIGVGLTELHADEDTPEEEKKVENPDEQATNPTVPGTSTSYVDEVSCLVTAYTHTGSTTATGTWPRSTRTYDNPGTCAVVPDTFPYGSLLYVTGYGYCIAEDTGGFRHDPNRWNQIDVFMNTAPECVTWGRRRDVKVYVIRYGR